MTEFQSLFSWMFRSKLAYKVAEFARIKFQSLFSWMFRSKLMIYQIIGSFKFQSLFSWMFRSKLVSFTT